MTDEELIAYFANVKDTDSVPASENPGETIRLWIYRLVDLGIMPEPRPTDMFIDVLHRARIACQRHLRREARLSND